MGYTVAWFQRDLRLHDHAPLVHAAVHGPVRPSRERWHGLRQAHMQKP